MRYTFVHSVPSPVLCKTAPTDWFGNSVYIPPEARAEVGREINAYLTTFHRLVRARGLKDVQFVLSGSLSRGEPAIGWSAADGWHLTSDIDMVAVISGGHWSPGLKADLIEEFCSLHSSVSLSIFDVEACDLRRVRSCFGRDLLASARRAGLVHTDVPLPRIGLRERLEVLAHQASNVLFNHHIFGPGMARDEMALQVTKLGAEAARVSVPDDQERDFTYGAAAGRLLVAHPTFDHAATDIVRARELTHLPPLALSDVRPLVGRTLGAILPTTRSQPASLMHRLELAYAPASDCLVPYQWLTLMALMRLPGGAQGSTALTDALRLLSAHAHGLADFALEYAAVRLSDTVGTEDGIRGLAPDVVQDLLIVRSAYYAELGPHNFGARPIPGYSTSPDGSSDGSPGSGPDA
jgi:hypothetical protein